MVSDFKWGGSRFLSVRPITFKWFIKTTPQTFLNQHNAEMTLFQLDIFTEDFKSITHPLNIDYYKIIEISKPSIVKDN